MPQRPENAAATPGDGVTIDAVSAPAPPDAPPDAPFASALTGAASDALPAPPAALPAPPAFDELHGRLVDATAPAPTPNADTLAGNPSLAPVWRRFFSHVPNGAAGLDWRAESLRRQIRDDDVSYNVYAGEGDVQRPWALDLLPLLLTPDDWQQIETGVQQRVRVLDRILSDLYGPQTLLKAGLLPPALVQGHPDYLPAMHGVEPLGGTHLHIAAFDLGRGPDGRWWVISQRLQAPSGLGYLLENRQAIARQFSAAFDGLHVSRLWPTYRALLDSLRAHSGVGSAANIVLLTPGPYNETYFEHVYLARYLGIALVEGGDLTVRQQRVYLKTLHGLEPVHGLIKRMDDQFLDPVELRPDSQLGVPGLMQAIRAGHVLLANAPGAGFLESGALLGFLPALARQLLGEELTLPALHSWWCGEPAARADALGQLGDGVLKPTYPRPYPGAPARRSFEPVLTRQLSAAQRADWRAQIEREPDEFTVQRHLPPSRLPTWRTRDLPPAQGAQQHARDPFSGHLGQRPAILRVFATSSGAGAWQVLPGGMARLVDETSGLSSMRWGGSSADVWVLSEQPQPAGSPSSVLPGGEAEPAVVHHPRRRLITSRAADNLFWLGRYTERVENDARLSALALATLAGEEQASVPRLSWLNELLRDQDLVAAETPSLFTDRHAFVQAVLDGLTRNANPAAVGHGLVQLRATAARVRDRLAQEQWDLVRSAQTQFFTACEQARQHAMLRPADALVHLRQLSQTLAAITGAQLDRMTRDDGWRLLSVGRYLERLLFFANALSWGFYSNAVHDDDGFEAVLALFDSTISYHARYQQSRDVAALLELLVTSVDNPRSIGCIVAALTRDLARLPPMPGASAGDDGLASRLRNPATTPLGSWCQCDEMGNYGPLQTMLDTCRQVAQDLSRDITLRYFAHAAQRHRSVSA